MATENIHNSALSKITIAEKLDTLADRVIKRGIIVAEKNRYSFFNIVDYFTKEVVIEDVPNYSIAGSLCEYFNSKKDINKRKTFIDVQHIINQYHKYNNDCLFYRRTVRQSSDIVKVEVALTRLDVTLLKLKSIQRQLQGYTK